MTDHEAIQGSWVSIAPSRPGYRIPIGPELIGSKLRYQLQSGTKPKRISLEHRDPGGRPRTSAQGVYELAGDSLTIRWAETSEVSPEALGTADQGDCVLHLQRVS